jgi:hypothetical protein
MSLSDAFATVFHRHSPVGRASALRRAEKRAAARLREEARMIQAAMADRIRELYP